MRTTMFAVCLLVFSAYFERKCTKIYDFQKISSKIVPGLFIMGFSHVLYVIFHFLGPAVVPPTRGPQTSILSRNLRLGSKNRIFSSKLLVRTLLVRGKSGTHNSGGENIIIFEASQNRGLKNDYFFSPLSLIHI